MTDLTQNYESAGFSGNLQFGGRPALLVVDMAEAYLQAHSPLYLPFAQCALSNTIEIATLCVELEFPVLLTEVSYEDMRQAGRFYEKVPALKAFKVGSPLSKLAPQLTDQVPHAETIKKHYASAFFGTDLSSRLVDKQIDTLIITGFSTSGCVRASALDAMQHGFAPFVVSDACADRNDKPHQANLFDLQAKYAEIVDTLTVKNLLEQSGP